MNIDDFQDLVDRCGERPENWPADIRAEAMQLLDSSPSAQAVVAEAASMRDLFAASPSERAPEDLAGRIVTLAGRMDDLRPTKNKNLRHDRLRFTDGDGVVGADFDGVAAGQALSPKMLLWFGVVFLAGLGVGVGGTLVSSVRQIDFATLFAILS